MSQLICVGLETFDVVCVCVCVCVCVWCRISFGQYHVFNFLGTIPGPKTKPKWYCLQQNQPKNSAWPSQAQHLRHPSGHNPSVTDLVCIIVIACDQGCP